MINWALDTRFRSRNLRGGRMKNQIGPHQNHKKVANYQIPGTGIKNRICR